MPLDLTRLLLASLLTAATAHAGQVVLAWDEDLDAQPGLLYSLQIVTLQGGRPTATERSIAPFPVEVCAQWPDTSTAPDSLCGQLCLEPGDYSLRLVASRAGARSDPSNVLDVDISSSSPCQAPPVATPPPAPAPSVPPPVIPLPVPLPPLSTGPPDNSPPSWTDLVNPACVSWKVLGPCVCNPLTPCVQVQYWEPGWLVETVKRPGTTSLDALSPILREALAVAGAPAFGGGGAGNATGSGHTNLQFTEAHVYAFPQLLGGPCTSCAPSQVPLTLHYASEADPTWRTATAVPAPTTLLQRIGVWALLYPRGGKSIHGSEPVASGIAATRAMDISFLPVGPPPQLDAHVVLAPTGASSTCCQLASPRRTPCFTAGTPPALWETATVSPRGTYLWIFWRQRQCCVLPAQTTCGITLPGVGSSGQNGCVLPSTP
jgi:hypothetical protein